MDLLTSVGATLFVSGILILMMSVFGVVTEVAGFPLLALSGICMVGGIICFITSVNGDVSRDRDVTRNERWTEEYA